LCKSGGSAGTLELFSSRFDVMNTRLPTGIKLTVHMQIDDVA
jgi:hypothetical protein